MTSQADNGIGGGFALLSNSDSAVLDYNYLLYIISRSSKYAIKDSSKTELRRGNVQLESMGSERSGRN